MDGSFLKADAWARFLNEYLAGVGPLETILAASGFPTEVVSYRIDEENKVVTLALKYPPETLFRGVDPRERLGALIKYLNEKGDLSCYVGGEVRLKGVGIGADGRDYLLVEISYRPG